LGVLADEPEMIFNAGTHEEALAMPRRSTQPPKNSLKP
jgi:hypothetical protein